MSELLQIEEQLKSDFLVHKVCTISKGDLNSTKEQITP